MKKFHGLQKSTTVRVTIGYEIFDIPNVEDIKLAIEVPPGEKLSEHNFSFMALIGLDKENGVWYLLDKRQDLNPLPDNFGLTSRRNMPLLEYKKFVDRVVEQFDPMLYYNRLKAFMEGLEVQNIDEMLANGLMADYTRLGKLMAKRTKELLKNAYSMGSLASAFHDGQSGMAFFNPLNYETILEEKRNNGKEEDNCTC